MATICSKRGRREKNNCRLSWEFQETRPIKLPGNFGLNSNALVHLKSADPVMGHLIKAMGCYRLELRENRFAALARAIVGQQLSVAAARTIWARFEHISQPITAESLSSFDVVSLRAIGLSNAKAIYVLDLAAKVRKGVIDLRSLDAMSDEDVIAILTQVKGIGRWTAEMFLIFSLGRTDILSTGDGGLRRAITLAYDISAPVTKGHIEDISSAWAPWRSVASLLLWTGFEN